MKLGIGSTRPTLTGATAVVAVALSGATGAGKSVIFGRVGLSATKTMTGLVSTVGKDITNTANQSHDLPGRQHDSGAYDVVDITGTTRRHGLKVSMTRRSSHRVHGAFTAAGLQAYAA